jgi:predicted secreted protein
MRTVLIVLLMVLGCARALAADGAAFNALGYSPDSRYFAFEQYGVQDGSGFPYWDVFVIDLKANAWVKGSPYRAMIESEEAKPAAARDQARAAAAAALKEFDITQPAELIAANPATEAVPERERLTFDRWYASLGARANEKSQLGVRFELSVEKIALPRPAQCPEGDGESFGVRVSLKDLQTGTSRVIHEDAAIPDSRNCPAAYDVAAVVAQTGFPTTDRLVALIGVYARGFEGMNHRFIAVPFTISD